MKLINKILIILIILFSISACSGLKESLSLKKKQGVDEFLIEKKNPLTVPPDYSSLPKPKNKIEIGDYVLQNFDEDEMVGLEKIIENIAESLSILVDKKLDLFSSKINHK